MKKLLLLLVIYIVPFQSSAEIYKWTDNQGQVHYGEKPPARQDSQRLHLHTPPASSKPVQKVDQQKLLEAFEEERNYRNAVKARQQKVEAQRQRNCNLARNNLKNYQTANHLYTLDDKGNRVVLDETERSRLIEKTREKMQHWCGE